MCGIAGFEGKKDFKKLDILLDRIEHRGRDERIKDYVLGVNLGMNRLAINDLTVNLFPFKYKKYTLIFNGEIYNYKEIKQDLIKKGVKVKTSCDGEVILPLYDLYGHDFLKYIEGMFAICIVDESKKNIFLARDRMGEKPLYYSETDDNFIFGSEMRILKDIDSVKKIDKKFLGEYFHNGFVSDGNTLIGEIKKIPMAHYLVYDLNNKRSKLQRYWKPEIKKSEESEKKIIKKLSELLISSVEERLLSDVPVGSFLSGGVDSSLITCLVSQKIKKMPVFSVAFPGFDEHNELKYAIQVAKRLNLKQEIVECTSKEAREVIVNLGKLIDEPIVDPAIIPTFLLAKKARESVKVVLTGEGADELFCGYDRYVKEMKIARVRGCLGWAKGLKNIMPGRYKKLFLDLDDYYSTQRIWKDEEIKKLIREEYVYRNGSDFKMPSSELQQMQAKDIEGYLADNLFMKVDKMTMKNNLEARAPFVSKKIVEFALGLDDRYKIRDGQGKYILKKMAEQYFGKEFVWRKKHGLSLPLKEWFLDDLKDLVYDSVALSKKYKDLVNVNYYKSIVSEHMDKRCDNSDKIWSMMVLLNWIKTHE